MIKYNKETLQLLKKLSRINPKISLEIINDNLMLFSNDSSGNVVYTLKVPKEGFDFERDKIHFLNFPDFYDSFETLSTKQDIPDLEILENDDQLYIEMTLGSSTMGIALAPGELMSNDDSGIKDLEDLEVLVKLDWKAERDKRFKGMINALTKANDGIIRFTSDCTNITIDILNDRQNNTFKETIEYPENSLKEFSYMFQKNIFTMAPDGDYIITLYEGGFVEVDLVTTEPIKLTFQTFKIDK